jgi:predicted chitinase
LKQLWIVSGIQLRISAGNNFTSVGVMIVHVNLVARLMKWIILVDIVLCVLLFLPDQVREFYRITVASSLSSAGMLAFWMVIVSITIWITANQIAIEAETQLGKQLAAPSPHADVLLRLLPIVMGFAPILAAASAQLQSIPEIPVASGSMLKVGSIVRIQANELVSNATRLKVMCGVLLGLGLVVGVTEWFVSKRARRFSDLLNRKYFSKPLSLIVTVILIVAAEAIFVVFPVKFPQAINVFGIVSIFTICICSFVVHVTLISDRYKIAIIPAVLIWVGFVAAIGSNDNHLVRSVSTFSQTTALRDLPLDFADWLRRPDRVAYSKGQTPKIYPVFVVAAQGGGAYAAYNAAAFLSRLQDLCPSFRHHLFAISSVSGGSVGAAAFAVALNSEDEAGRTEGLEQINLREPCPQVTKFLARERAIDDLGKPGILERDVNTILRSDFLSPLVGAALFPDFTQSFLPIPVPEFDRARSLEYAFEAAGQNIIEMTPDGSNPLGLLERDYFSHWSAQRSFPALLFNATDAGTGKRVVISPFKLVDTQKFSDEVCLFANSSETDKAEIDDKYATDAVPALTTIPIPLSTAAFISARFPWVTPAATARINNPCLGKSDTVRLVDGGYLDNSGVETALGLIERLKQAAKAARAQDPNIPEVGIHLISLTGGDFPTRSSYSFNDALEPIRALLSGRETRAYIALNRARASLSDSDAPGAQSFDRTDLRSMFYRLPLGWSLSQRTRNIIAHESGRYWDCEPGLQYSQTRSFLSNSDCIQLHVNFLLKGVMPEALQELKQAEKYRGDFSSQPPVKLDSEALLSCYENWWDDRQKAAWEARNSGSARARLTSSLNYRRQYFSFYQAEQMRDLLLEWDEIGSAEDHPNMLAYVLASLSLDAQEFRRASELLSFESVSSLEEVWGKRIRQIDEANGRKSPPLPTVDRSTLLNNPKALAQLVWTNRFGNNSADDAWKYRARGLYQIVGREQYTQYSRLIRYDLIENPDAVWNRRASARIAFAHYLHWLNPTTRKGLADFVKKDQPDWKGARENDIDGSTDNAAEVAERSKMFLGCIESARK